MTLRKKRKEEEASPSSSTARATAGIEEWTPPGSVFVSKSITAAESESTKSQD
ncbi:hypothetical protein FRC00_012736, partial [Tulasnella sp. 408]